MKQLKLFAATALVALSVISSVNASDFFSLDSSDDIISIHSTPNLSNTQELKDEKFNSTENADLQDLINASNNIQFHELEPSSESDSESDSDLLFKLTEGEERHLDAKLDAIQEEYENNSHEMNAVYTKLYYLKESLRRKKLALVKLTNSSNNENNLTNQGPEVTILAIKKAIQNLMQEIIEAQNVLLTFPVISDHHYSLFLKKHELCKEKYNFKRTIEKKDAELKELREKLSFREERYKVAKEILGTHFKKIAELNNLLAKKQNAGG